MEAVANSRFARFSYRKVGQVLDLIRGKSVAEAFGMLPWVPRACRVLVAKTLRSAVANAGGKTDPATLSVSQAWVNHGPVMKRVMPKAQGSRAIIKRKTCHLTIVVSDAQKAKRN
jgi:large subunit ribosomal protein L22